MISGGGGSDAVTGGLGNDSILVQDGVADTVSCGAGTDSATADLIDTIAADCESVTLPPPVVMTGSASNVKKDNAVLNGTRTARPRSTTSSGAPP